MFPDRIEVDESNTAQVSSAIIGTKRGHRFLAPELITVLLITDDFAGGIRLAFDQSLL